VRKLCEKGMIMIKSSQIKKRLIGRFLLIIAIIYSKCIEIKIRKIQLHSQPEALSDEEMLERIRSSIESGNEE
jgi:CII-binding regulator of phage lambda lysogenization HflD